MECHTEYVEKRDVATQTGGEDLGAGHVYKMALEVATLANSFLHASYWFLVMEITFSSRGLEGLTRAAKRREESCREAAGSLLSLLKVPQLLSLRSSLAP